MDDMVLVWFGQKWCDVEWNGVHGMWGTEWH